MRSICGVSSPIFTCSLTLAAAGLAAACGDPVPVPTTIAISPASAALHSLSETVRLTATVQDQHGQAMSGSGLRVTWTSGSESVVKVDATGLATAVGNGSAAIKASLEDVVGTAEVRVEQQPAMVDVWPETVAFVAFGDTVRLSGQAVDANGHVIENVALTWTSEDDSVVTVDSTGVLTAVGNGTVTVRASVGDVAGVAGVTVEQQAEALRVSPEATMLLALGDTVRLLGQAVDANGHVVEDAGVDITWSSEDESVVMVDVDGLVTAAGKGMTRVWAVADTLELAGFAEVKVDLHRGALLKIYDAMGGPGWRRSDNWGTVKPLGQWYGVVSDALGNVIELDLHFNYLTNSIPPEIVALETLEVLKLYNNSIDGSIPAELEHLEHLQVLNLSANPLGGSIPPELGNLQDLRILSIIRAGLTGSIPPELANLNNLRELDLSENSLGSIPAELANLRNLESLVLWNTQLTGSIPPELGNLNNLLELDFGNNSNLTGSVPPELGNLRNLEQLEISETGLSGALPPEFGDLGNLELLGVNNTKLKGALPLDLIEVPLYVFQWYETELCAPTDEDFQEWLDSIVFHDGGPNCDDP